MTRIAGNSSNHGPCYFLCLQLSLGTHISVGEEVRYTSDPENSDRTLLTQQAVVCIKGIPLIDQMERLLTKTIEQNAKKVNGYMFLSLSFYQLHCTRIEFHYPNVANGLRDLHILNDWFE